MTIILDLVSVGYFYGAICGVIGYAIYGLIKYYKSRKEEKQTGNPRHFGRRAK